MASELFSELRERCDISGVGQAEFIPQLLRAVLRVSEPENKVLDYLREGKVTIWVPMHRGKFF